MSTKSSSRDASRTKNEQALYIVTLKTAAVTQYEGGVDNMAATKPRTGEKFNKYDSEVKKYSSHLEQMHAEILRECGAKLSDKVYSYTFSTNGFAAKLTSQQAAELKQSGKVLSIKKSQLRKLNTNSTPKFLGLSGPGKVWTRGYTGENVVIGVIDSGINPEHTSFADVATPEDGFRGRLIPYGPVPAQFTGEECSFGNVAANPLDQPFECNNKLVGASYFVEGMQALVDAGEVEFAQGNFFSARDSDGHGSLTASIAAGNYGVDAVIAGDNQGSISGMAPRARVAAYKPCWNLEFESGFLCDESDLVKAIDQAVADGVDVVNYSIGGFDDTLFNTDSVAMLRGTTENGVMFALSAGNSGYSGPTDQAQPWITSVGASHETGSTSIIEIEAPSSLSGSYPALLQDIGVSLNDAGTISASLVPTNTFLNEGLCFGIDPEFEVEDQIAVAVSSFDCSIGQQIEVAQAAGAKAIIFVEFFGGIFDFLEDDLGGFVPAIPVLSIPDYSFSFLATLEDEYFFGADVNAVTGPNMTAELKDALADFSSRGNLLPNAFFNDRPFIVPDIIAPGVDIIGAGPSAAQGNQTFISLSGTSFASPHIAGIFALIKQAHPEWTPAMAKSAIMTSARTNITKGPYDLNGFTGESDPFGVASPLDIGAGFVQTLPALNPGLVYNAERADYVAYTCSTEQPLGEEGECDQLQQQGYSFASQDLNLPSIAVPRHVGITEITRKVTSVARGRRFFRAIVEAPEGTNIRIQPSYLILREGETAEFKIIITNEGDVLPDDSEHAFGSLTWKWGGRYGVTSPIAIVSSPLQVIDRVVLDAAQGNTSIEAKAGVSDININAVGLVQGQPVQAQIEPITEEFGIGTTAINIGENSAFTTIGLYDQEDSFLAVYGPMTQDDIEEYFNFPSFDAINSFGSAQSVTLIEPEAGVYVVEIFEEFFDAPAPTDPKPVEFFQFTDAGEPGGTFSAQAGGVISLGDAFDVNLSWSDLVAGERYEGVIFYTKNGEAIASTSVGVNLTQ